MVNKLLDEHECPLDIQLFKLINMQLDLFYNIGFTPNAVTTLSLIFGLFSAQQILVRNYKIAALLFFLAYYLDCVDGKLARKYNMVSKFGDVYDHVSDIVKVITVIWALIMSNKKKTTSKQWIFLILLFLLCFMQCIHLGYQEVIYNKHEETSTLNVLRKIVKNDKTPEETIRFTKYFGCGTWYLCFAVVIIFWPK
jgi:phosphatidylglycerophosphate synthase